ncbi:hypothetical protein ACOSQ3_010760 [Xanthoceras sorbifolium]
MASFNDRPTPIIPLEEGGVKVQGDNSIVVSIASKQRVQKIQKDMTQSTFTDRNLGDVVDDMVGVEVDVDDGVANYSKGSFEGDQIIEGIGLGLEAIGVKDIERG